MDQDQPQVNFLSSYCWYQVMNSVIPKPKLWLVKKTFWVGHFMTISGHFIPHYINIFSQKRGSDGHYEVLLNLHHLWSFFTKLGFRQFQTNHRELNRFVLVSMYNLQKTFLRSDFDFLLIHDLVLVATCPNIYLVFIWVHFQKY